MAKTRGKGLLIAFEGGEGAGKSTQMKRLVTRLRRAKIPVVLTLQPGGTVLGRKIREVLLNPKNRGLTPRAELLLYLADRAQHVDELVVPAMAKGTVVVTDRYADSSTVYQGIARGLGLQKTADLNAYATDGLFPDLVILLDLPVEVGRARVKSRIANDVKLKGKRRAVKLDRLERENAIFHSKVRNGFLKMARLHPRRYAVIDATQSPDEVSTAIERAVTGRLKARGYRGLS